MIVNIEALVELKGVKAQTEEVAESIKAETGLTARITNSGTYYMTNVPRTYVIVLRGTSESEGEAESLQKHLRSMMRNYGKNGDHPVVAASYVCPIITETQAKARVSSTYGTRTTPGQYYRRRGAR